eukprot:7375964-Prymnesium_polylepis.1
MLTGQGTDYRGYQNTARSGYVCQAWASHQSPHNHSYMPTNYPEAGLLANYCRNPDGSGRTI